MRRTVDSLMPISAAIVRLPSHRLQAMGNKNYRNGFVVTLQPHMLQHPLGWKSPKRIFVNSMSDLFHEKAPFL